MFRSPNDGEHCCYVEDFFSVVVELFMQKKFFDVKYSLSVVQSLNFLHCGTNYYSSECWITAAG